MLPTSGFKHGQGREFKNAHTTRQALGHLAHQTWLRRPQNHEAAHALSIGINRSTKGVKQGRQALRLIQDQPLARAGIQLETRIFCKRSFNHALSPERELRDACVHVEQRGHMRCRGTQRY